MKAVATWFVALFVVGIGAAAFYKLVIQDRDSPSRTGENAAERQQSLTGSVRVHIQGIEGSPGEAIRQASGVYANGEQHGAGVPCDGSSVSDGFSDLVPGAGVTVKNERGEIIAVGELKSGSWEGLTCKLALEVPELPKAKFYEVEVGNRGEQRFSAAQLEGNSYRVDLSIGD